MLYDLFIGVCVCVYTGWSHVPLLLLLLLWWLLFCTLFELFVVKTPTFHNKV
jgi:hypothetical protein